MKCVLHVCILTSLIAFMACGSDPQISTGTSGNDIDTSSGGPPPEDTTASLAQDLESAPEAVKKSILALGNVSKWNEVRRIEGEVALCMYGDRGDPYVSRYTVRMIFDPGLKPKRIVARSMSDMKFMLDLDAKGRDSAPRYSRDPRLQQEVARALYLYMLKFRGPWNLLSDRPLTVTGDCRIVGEDLTRVGVDKGAYYFKRDTHLLRYVTTGADLPGQEGLITTYEYVVQNDGLAIPHKILVTRLGRHVLIGVDPVMSGEIFGIKFYKTVD